MLCDALTSLHFLEKTGKAYKPLPFVEAYLQKGSQVISATYLTS
jgi:hypothetical protein